MIIVFDFSSNNPCKTSILICLEKSLVFLFDKSMTILKIVPLK